MIWKQKPEDDTPRLTATRTLGSSKADRGLEKTSLTSLTSSVPSSPHAARFLGMTFLRAHRRKRHPPPRKRHARWRGCLSSTSVKRAVSLEARKYWTIRKESNKIRGVPSHSPPRIGVKYATYLTFTVPIIAITSVLWSSCWGCIYEVGLGICPSEGSCTANSSILLRSGYSVYLKSCS